MTKIKICGLYRPEDITYVNQYRPDWCGFIINFPKSHRSLAPDQVRELRRGLDPAVIPVGVFVDQPVEDAAALLNDGTISIAQLHGHEDAAYIEKLRQLAPDRPIWKAFKMRAPSDLDAVNASPADLVVLDNGYGTGEAFNWSLAAGVKRLYLLAGGLGPENISDAIIQLHPYGLDISSGVETEKIKDPSKIHAAVCAARKD